MRPSNLRHIQAYTLMRPVRILKKTEFSEFRNRIMNFKFQNLDFMKFEMLKFEIPKFEFEILKSIIEI